MCLCSNALFLSFSCLFETGSHLCSPDWSWTQDLSTLTS
jgi:hypothetical protein